MHRARRARHGRGGHRPGGDGRGEDRRRPDPHALRRRHSARAASTVVLTTSSSGQDGTHPARARAVADRLGDGGQRRGAARHGRRALRGANASPPGSPALRFGCERLVVAVWAGAVVLTICASRRPSAPWLCSLRCTVDDSARCCVPGAFGPLALGTTSMYWSTPELPGGATVSAAAGAAAQSASATVIAAVRRDRAQSRRICFPIRSGASRTDKAPRDVSPQPDRPYNPP